MNESPNKEVKIFKHNPQSGRLFINAELENGTIVLYLHSFDDEFLVYQIIYVEKRSNEITTDDILNTTGCGKLFVYTDYGNTWNKFVDAPHKHLECFLTEQINIPGFHKKIIETLIKENVLDNSAHSFFYKLMNAKPEKL